VAIIAYWLLAPLGYQAWVGHPLFPRSATTQPGMTGAAQMSPHDEVALSTIAPAVGVLTLIAFNLLWRTDPFARLGLTFRKLWRSASWQGPLAAVIILPLMFGMVFLTEKFWNVIHFSHPEEHDLLRILGEEPRATIRRIIIVAAVALAPLAEEFFFRGMLQNAIRKLIDECGHFTWLSQAIAIGLVSVAFALAHGALWMMPPLFFFSLCLGCAYAFTRNLWVPMFVHAAFNAVSIATFLATRHG
jgi:membrane protease YdiL (CAAX protease family)